MSLSDVETDDLTPKDVEFIVSNHEFEPRKLRRDGFKSIDKRERLAYGHHFRHLNAQGKSQYAIAKDFDCSQAIVSILISESRAASEPIAREAANKAELETNAVLLDKWMPRALSDDAEVAAAAMPHIVKLLDMRARLTGAYAPEQVETTYTQVTQADLELTDLVNEAKTRAATEHAPAPVR